MKRQTELLNERRYFQIIHARGVDFLSIEWTPITQHKKNLYRQFSKEDKEIAKRRMKRFSTSLNIRETPIEITMRYHFTFVRMAVLKKTTNNSITKDMEEK